MQAQAFGFDNLTHDFDVAQQLQKQASATTINVPLEGITVLMLVLTF